MPANGGNAASLGGNAPTYYASAGLVSSLDYLSVGALSSGTTIPSTYGDVGAASAAHTHTYSDVGALSAGTHIPSDPVNAD